MAAVLLTLLPAFTAFAEDYSLYAATWDASEGAFVAYWEQKDDSAKTSFKVTLYKSFTSDDNKVLTVTENRLKHDFTSSIISRGIGKYYFTVYSVKGGEDTLIVSDELNVTADDIREAKGNKQKQKSDTGLTPYPLVEKWVKNPGGTWNYQLADGTTVKSQWAVINNYRYYFNSLGTMLTGWNAIDGKWYYLEPKGTAQYPEGACYLNTTTPDGYQVNADGAWVINGVVQPAKNSYTTSTKKVNTVFGKTISELNVYLKIYNNANGIRVADVTGGSNSKVTGVSMSSPVESWQPGVPVTITATFIPSDGYEYSTFLFSAKCSNAAVASCTGTKTSQTVVLTYTPSVQLAAPKDLKVDGSYTVTWSAVPFASRYRVKINTQFTSVKTVYVAGTSCNVAEYCKGNESRTTIEVTAVGPEGSTAYIESPVSKITTLEQDITKATTGRSLVKVGKGLMYKEPNGTYLTGWHQILGSWYYFGNDGYALSGLFTDTDGNQYYFNQTDHRMETGYVGINGQKYFFNDGSIAGLPYGARNRAQK